jgi:hypothetical protein
MAEATAENVASSEPVTVTEKETPVNTDVKKVSPAQDLRNIQALLAGGLFPGNYAPQVTMAYQLLEKMASQIEMEASKVSPVVTSKESK